MHRRARHLNHGRAGATVYCDARRISGVSDGSTVQTWSDLSGSANDVAQATAGNRPTYKTSIIGGQPIMRFASASTNWMKNTGYSITSNAATVFCTAQTAATVTTSGRFVSLNNGGGQDYDNTNAWAALYYDGTTNKAASYRNNAQVVVSGGLSKSTPYVMSIVLNGTAVDLYIKSVKTSGTTSSTAMNSNRLIIGANEPELGNSRLDGDIGSFSIFKSSLSDPLRKRIEHSMAYSYKVQSN